MEHLLRIKGIDPDEFLNQKTNHGDGEGDGNYSECSDSECECCCSDNCRDENGSSDNQTTERSDDASASVDNGHKIEVQTSQQKIGGDEQSKKNSKERKDGKDVRGKSCCVSSENCVLFTLIADIYFYR